MSKVTRRRIRTLGEAQNWRCAYCGTPVEPEHDHPRRATLDHVIPKRHGGQNHKGNLVVACHTCNSGRGSKDAYGYFEARQKQIAKSKPKLTN